jgi:hypothetical protein
LPHREESESLDRLLATLEAHGASGPAGWQVHQEQLAELAGFRDKRQMFDFLKCAKEHGLVVVTPNRVGSGFGSTVRQADSYHLKVTAAEWAEMRGPIVAAKEADLNARRSATQKAAHMERERLVRIAKRGGARARAAAEAVPIDEVAVLALAASYDDDVDLEGW